MANHGETEYPEPKMLSCSACEHIQITGLPINILATKQNFEATSTNLDANTCLVMKTHWLS